MITEATPQDWEDFWYAPEKFGTWYPEDFQDEEDQTSSESGTGSLS